MKKRTEDSESNALYEELITQFTVWASPRTDVRAAFIIGSRARTEYPADEWADLDIIIVTTDPDYYIENSEWVQNIGTPLLTFEEPTATGDNKERRVLFEGMLDVDFAIVPEEKVEFLHKMPPEAAAQLADTVGRGIRVLFDKDGITEKVLTSIPSEVVYHPPTEKEYHELVSDFLYHCVWTVKHLRRGELWWSKSCCDSYLKRLLLTMVEWHSRAVHGPEYDTWFRGRFLEKWADPRVLKELREAFAYYDEKDVKRALMKSMGLFRWLAMETGEILSYPYLTEADKRVTLWVESQLS